jgi:hypothetical protein
MWRRWSLASSYVCTLHHKTILNAADSPVTFCHFLLWEGKACFQNAEHSQSFSAPWNAWPLPWSMFHQLVCQLIFLEKPLRLQILNPYFPSCACVSVQPIFYLCMSKNQSMKYLYFILQWAAEFKKMYYFKLCTEVMQLHLLPQLGLNTSWLNVLHTYGKIFNLHSLGNTHKTSYTTEEVQIKSCHRHFSLAKMWRGLETEAVE